VDTIEVPSDADLAASVSMMKLKGSVKLYDLSGSVKPWVETKGDVTTISTDVLFEFAKYDIDASGEKAIAEALKTVPNGASVDVTGHTDSIGTDEGNMLLSQQRASAVASIINRDRPDLTVNAAGKGSHDPVAKNTNSDGSDNPEGRAQNRRVEIRHH